LSERNPSGWRRIYEFWKTYSGVFAGAIVVLGAIAALLIATEPFGGDADSPVTALADKVPGPARTTKAAWPPRAGENTATRDPPCSDGRDNDGDGKTDHGSDPGCSAATDRTEKEASCSDGRDNDGDGKTDFGPDPDCSSPEDWIEKKMAVPLTCSDGRDNDGDGKADFDQDHGCSSAVDRTEQR